MIGENQIGKPVIVRTDSAGVHVGVLLARNGKEVEIAEGRQIWRWRGANTLLEIARSGIQSAEESDYTRVSEAAPDSTVVTEAIAVITMDPAAYKKVCEAGWTE